MIKAVIFDMDGLLIDSEAMWQEAQAMIFAKVGIFITKETTCRNSSLLLLWIKRGRIK